MIFPPEFMTEGSAVVCYDEYLYEMMQCFISEGADVKDPKICKFFMEEHAESVFRDTAFRGGKRILTLEVYNILEGIGFNINKNDVLIIDESDKRTKYVPLKVKRAREQLDAGTALRHIEEIRAEVESFVDNIFDGRLVALETAVIEVQIMLQDWLDINLSDQTIELGDLVADLPGCRGFIEISI